MPSTGILWHVSQCLCVCSHYFSQMQRPLLPATLLETSGKWRFLSAWIFTMKAFWGKGGTCVQIWLVATCYYDLQW